MLRQEAVGVVREDAPELVEGVTGRDRLLEKFTEPVLIRIPESQWFRSPGLPVSPALSAAWS